MEPVEITPEMIAAYQRQQREEEQRRQQTVIDELIGLARVRGYQIAAIPQIMDDGRLGGIWGLRPLQG